MDKNTNAKQINDLTNVPAAACKICGGWTTSGGMSQHAFSQIKVLGRTGCLCIHIRKKIA